MYNIRSKGRFVTVKRYALETVVEGVRAISPLNWVRIILVLPWLLMYLAWHVPETVELAQAEEIATSTEVAAIEKKEVRIEVRIDWTRERIDEEIERQAAKYGKNAEHLKKIVECESGYDTDIQSGHMLSYGREQSFGLAQIHLPSHPNVTYEQAIDPAFAIEFLAKNYGKVSWSCSKLI